MLPQSEPDEIVTATAPISPELWAELTASIERMNDALRLIAEGVSEALARWAAAFTDYTLYGYTHPTPTEEAAYRAYARAYNWRHAGRRVSWRRLNRAQRRAALKAAGHE